MANVVEVVGAIALFQKHREEAIKDREVHQKELEDSVTKYMVFLLYGKRIVRDLYAELVRVQSNGLLATDDLRIKTLDNCIEMLQNLVMQKATPEEYEKGLDDAEAMLLEMKRKSWEIMDTVIHG